MRRRLNSPVSMVILTCLLLAHAGPQGWAQDTRTQQHIKVGTTVPVSGDRPTTPHIEPHVAVHPANPDHLVGAAVTVMDSTVISLFVSVDGGQSWSRTLFPRCWLDPWITFGADDTVFFACLENKDRVAVLVYRSADGGRTWNEPTEVPFETGAWAGTPAIREVSGYDHESMVFDRTEGPYQGTLYMVAFQAVRMANEAFFASPVFLKSTDAGRSFAPPVRIIASNVWANTMNPVVFSDGSVGFAFYDFAVDLGDSMRPLRTKRISWVRSDDGGRSFTVPYLVAETTETSTLPLLAVDPSEGPFQDRLYLAVDDVRAGKAGVYLFFSEDEGEQWSEAVRITDVEHPDPIFANPAVTVGTDGVVGVAWYDGRHATDGACWDLYFSASLDGGETFLPNVRVSEETACSNVPGNVVERGGGERFDVARRWPSGGDYFGLVVLPGGAFQLLWADSRTGVYQLWTARIDVRDEASSDPLR